MNFFSFSFIFPSLYNDINVIIKLKMNNPKIVIFEIFNTFQNYLYFPIHDFLELLYTSIHRIHRRIFP